MDFNLDKFIAFNETENSKVWDIGNNVLYSLCRKYPKHNTVDEVVAKLWLIGRSYAAAIERRQNKEESNDRFYVKAARDIIESEIDNHIQKIPESKELTVTNILIICDAHAFLTKLFYKITKLYKSSLASKYLHFHRPIVPILDSRSRKGIGKAVRRDKLHNKLFKELRREGRRPIVDKFNDYLSFVIRVHLLQKYIHTETGNLYTVREIDRFILERLEA